MFGALVVADCPHNETPDDPVVSILGVLLYTFLDLLDCLSHLAFLEKSKSPMTVTVVCLWVIQLCTTANVYCLLVELMHIVQKREVIVGILVLWIELGTLLEVLYCLVILLELEVGKT